MPPPLCLLHWGGRQQFAGAKLKLAEVTGALMVRIFCLSHCAYEEQAFIIFGACFAVWDATVASEVPDQGHCSYSFA